MRYVLAWEMGRNYGHVAMLAELARMIAKKQKKKAEIFFVVQNPSAVLPFLNGLPCTVLQAPFQPESSRRPVPQSADAKGAKNTRPPRPPYLNYSEVLRPGGYGDEQVLAGLIRAWRDLYALIQPDVIICNAAPTALLAAKGLKVKTASIGGSYDIPAKSVPMPLLQPSEKIDPKLVLQRENEILNSIHQAQALNGLKPVKSVAEMITPDIEFLTIFEEMDHYSDRAGIEGKKPRYLGQFFSLESGKEMSWNKKADKRILAYLRPDSPGFGQAAAVFMKMPATMDIIVAAPGLPEHMRKAGERPNLRIVSGPVKLGPLLKDCDLGVCHASQGISCAFALNGIPQMLFPGHAEQLAFARALGRHKMGLGLVGRFGPDKVREFVNTLLNNPLYTESARTFAEKYKSFKPEKLAEQIADEILGLVQKG